MISISLKTFFSPKPRQSGAAILLTSIILLAISSMVILSTATTSNTNQKVIGNQLRMIQAFEAAEAGLEYGLSYLKTNAATIMVDSDNDGFIDPYSNAATQNITQSNGTQFSFSFANPTINNFDIITLTANGVSNDGSVTRTVSQKILKLEYLQTTPPAGFIGKYDISLGGNVTITIHNDINGHTIWSGGAVNLSGSAGTNCGPGCGSDKNAINDDITQNDPNLSTITSDQFFYSFFNMDKTTAKSKATLTYTNSSNTNYNDLLNGVEGQIIWIDQSGGGEATINSNTVIGSPENPVILIVDGDFKANGGATIYGAVYVIGDWQNEGGGSLDIHGAAISEGNFSGTGTPDVNFDQSVLSNVNKLVDYVKIPGSWRDF